MHVFILCILLRCPQIAKIVEMADSGRYVLQGRRKQVSWDAMANDLALIWQQEISQCRQKSQATTSASTSSAIHVSGMDCRAAYRKARSAALKKGPWTHEEVSGICSSGHSIAGNLPPAYTQYLTLRKTFVEFEGSGLGMWAEAGRRLGRSSDECRFDHLAMQYVADL
jgi:hypothetical protein